MPAARRMGSRRVEALEVAASTRADKHAQGFKIGRVRRWCMALEQLVRPVWPPLRHVERGWAALSAEQQAHVECRLAKVLEGHVWPDHMDREALATFFSFLAQVETIAIEIPLRFLPAASPEQAELLREQLVDEVFHSVAFARLAHELTDGASPPIVASAERLLDRIRATEDLATGATLLNLVAEGWIETLFEHAASWGIADPLFAAVLEDESRHVCEALEHAAGMDAARARDDVWALEAGLMEVQQEPAVSLAMLHIAGPSAYGRLVDDLWSHHRRHLAAVGLEPSPAWQEMEQVAGDAARARDATDVAGAAQGDGSLPVGSLPKRIEDSPWRMAARKVWDVPRNPTMQGGFDVPVGHVPKRLLTPVLVAALGRAWHANPRFNRIVHQDGVWELPRANVGVRVLVGDGELATVVITDAHRRSVRDISYMIRDGVGQLEALWHRRPQPPSTGQAADAPPAFDPALGKWLPPEAAQFSVALSNPGKFGLVSGAGAFSGHLSPATDISVGERRRLPKWRGLAYLPAWHVHLGCLQDHRVFDGREAGQAMTALRQQLSRRNVKAILQTPDSLEVPRDPPVYDDAWFAALPPSLRALPQVGFTKYLPLVIGGAAAGAALGLGGYFLADRLGERAATQQQQVVVVVEEGDEVLATDGEET